MLASVLLGPVGEHAPQSADHYTLFSHTSGVGAVGRTSCKDGSWMTRLPVVVPGGCDEAPSIQAW